MSNQNEMTLENMMDELDNCVKQLENSDISLEDSFHIYEKGMEYVKLCNERIDKVEKKVLLLEEDGSTSIFDDDKI